MTSHVSLSLSLRKVTIGKDAVKGDIALNIAGYKAADGKNLIADESDLLIAKYGDEAVTVSTADEENLPENRSRLPSGIKKTRNSYYR